MTTVFSVTPGGDDGGGDFGVNWRFALLTGALTAASGNTGTITLQLGSSCPTSATGTVTTGIIECWIGQATTTTNPPHFTGNQVQVKFGGNAFFPGYSPNKVITSDTFTLGETWDHTKNYIVTFYEAQNTAFNTSTTIETGLGANYLQYNTSTGQISEAGNTTPSQTYSLTSGQIQLISNIVITTSGTVALTAANFADSSPAFAAATVVLLGIFLGDQVESAGLTVLNTQATHVNVLTFQPTSYADVAAKLLGAANPGINNVSQAGSGRTITTNATNVTMTAAGTATAWAITDNTNSRLLASGPLSASQVVAINDIWQLPAFTITLPN